MDSTDDATHMKNIACFNELSVKPICQTKSEAEIRVKKFVCLINKLREHTGITKIRHASDLTEILLMEKMSMQDFCNDNIRSPYAIALLSTFVNPQVDMDDDESLQNYLDTTTEVYINSQHKEVADGFNAAYCQGTFCVGFDSDSIWQQDFFDISIKSNNSIKIVKWACISSLDFYSSEKEHQHRKSDFDLWLKGISPINLINSDKSPHEKSIDLRDDHGKDKLKAHAKLLCNHPNVESILTSLPFKSHVSHYIYKIYDDGLIDVVLYWEDKGYCMRVKTTGRNIIETTKIASLIKNKYGKP